MQIKYGNYWKTNEIKVPIITVAKNAVEVFFCEFIIDTFYIYIVTVQNHVLHSYSFFKKSCSKICHVVYILTACCLTCGMHCKLCQTDIGSRDGYLCHCDIAKG